MPDMNDKITQAVLFTVRDIESRKIFERVTPLPSKSLIDFMMSRNDDLSKWLNEKVNARSDKREKIIVPIEQFKQITESIRNNADSFETECGSVYSEDSSLITSILESDSLEELQAIKASFLSVYDELPSQNRDQWELIYKFICSIPDVDSSDAGTESTTHAFTIKDYDEDLANSILNANQTHCDKDAPLVRDRLGWYCKDDGPEGNSVVCAVYPWRGETSDNHNIEWVSTLLAMINETYPSIKRVLLVCHDRDFSGFAGKDEVVKGQFLEELQSSFPQLQGFVVFQHSNRTIIDALNKQKAFDVYDAIRTYVDGYGKIKKIDADCINAEAHDSYVNRGKSVNKEGSSHED